MEHINKSGQHVAGWRADATAIEELAARKVTWVYREEDVPAHQMPDALVCEDGSRVASREQWERRRRPETLELFRRHVYGRSPGRPGDLRFEVLATDAKALEGRATLKRVRISVTGQEGKPFSFTAAVAVPHGAGRRPAPAFVLIHIRPPHTGDPMHPAHEDYWRAAQAVERGYAAAVFQVWDVDPDKDQDEARAQGVRSVLASPGKTAEDAWATIAAWAWAASRVMDYLQTDPDIDASKVAVVGHSRGGKTALWAGAEDPRFALVVSNNSGCAGAALSRRRFGETVEAINRQFPYWFCGNFKRYNDREQDLPLDQHQLLALIAPRALYVTSADTDFWADPRGEFLSLAHASAVYALYGDAPIAAEEMPALETPLVRGRMAYHIRRGAHGLKPYDWQRFMDFADALWRG